MVCWRDWKLARMVVLVGWWLASTPWLACSPSDENKEKRALDGGFADVLDGAEKQSSPALLSTYTLASKDTYPEGIAFDPKKRAFFVGSLQRGDIGQIDADGKESLFFASKTPNTRSLGLKVDAERRRLWACVLVVQPEKESLGFVWVFDLDKATQVATYPMSEADTKMACNDLALDQQGSAYVTDPSLPHIYKIAHGASTRAIFAKHDLLKPTIPGLGLNGITLTPDGAYLLVVRYLPGQMFRIKVADPSDVQVVSLTGDPFDTPDGIMFLRGALFAVSDKTVHRVTFTNGDYLAGTVKSIEMTSSGLSTATRAEEKLYVVKSEVQAFVLKKEPNLPFQIIEIPIAQFGP